MTLNQLTRRDDDIARRYEYDDREVIVADLGVRDEDVTVDVLGRTAIVVVDDGAESRQTEIELPDGEAQAFINNGVVTIEVRR